MSTENLHEGHREMMKNRFLKSGFSGFEDHLILEMILFFAIPRKDTNPVSHRLINRFGTLSGVFNAPFSELCKIEGVGKQAATLIKTYPEVAKRYFESLTSQNKKTPTYEELGQKFIVKFAGLEKEGICAVFFDNAMKVCGECFVEDGDINTVGFSMRDFVTEAVRCKAANCVLAHNHPHGIPIASSNDLHTTSSIRTFFAQINVDVLDHFIIADGKFSSITKERYVSSAEAYIKYEE